jgi:S-(hydroxymethyl)glutathione dehydrogenase / alcohol dehydrogenase
MSPLSTVEIRHSDIFYMNGAWGGDLPAVHGHEAVGAGVSRLKSGDHVVVTLIRNCGFCPACAEGAPVFCEEVFPLDKARASSAGTASTPKY